MVMDRVKLNFTTENGYTNDYYYKHVLYGEHYDENGNWKYHDNILVDEARHMNVNDDSVMDVGADHHNHHNHHQHHHKPHAISDHKNKSVIK